jgi:hypothetical protein
MSLSLILAVIAVGVTADIVGWTDVGDVVIWVGVVLLVFGPVLTFLIRRTNRV